MLVEDKIIIDKRKDFFNLYSKAESIRDIIIDKKSKAFIEKNNMIALYGEWGSGKSSVLATIESFFITNEKYKILWFDTWKYEKEKNIAYSILKKINSLSTSNSNEILKKGWQVLNVIGNNIDIGLRVPFLGEVRLNKVLKTINDVEATINSKEENDVINFESDFKKINFENKKLIVFLDDLDRCEQENILSLISSIKLLLSTNKDIIFIFAIDKDGVTKALKNKYSNDSEKAEEFLEKIFPLNFSMASKAPELEKFVEQYKFSYGQLISDFLKNINFCNPRKVKKILNKYQIIRNKIKINSSDFEVLILIYLIILKQYCEKEFFIILNGRKNISLGTKISFKVIDGPSHSYDANWWSTEANNKTIFLDGCEINVFPIVELLTPYNIPTTKIEMKTTARGGIKCYLHQWMNAMGEGFFYEVMRFFIHDKTNNYLLEEIKIFDPELKKLEAAQKVCERIKDIANEVDKYT